MNIIDFNKYINTYKGLLIKTEEDFERNLLKAKAFIINNYPQLKNVTFFDEGERLNYEICLIELTEYYYNTEYNKGNKNGYDGNTNINFLPPNEQKLEKLEIIKTYIPSKYLYVGRRTWKQ